MEEILRALNGLIRDGVIEKYAIGGAVGAAFYIPAVQTEDVDAFVFFAAPQTGLISLSPVYEALVHAGGVPDREHLRFGSWPLQILTDATPLITAAIRSAQEVMYEDVPTRVFRPEYLCAVALEAGRTKDFLRVATFLEHAAVSEEELVSLVQQYGLEARWAKAKLYMSPD